VANFCLLTQQRNLEIGKRDHRDFLKARQELLAAAANDFLATLRSGTSKPARLFLTPSWLWRRNRTLATRRSRVSSRCS
jgi:hypothetical protein